MAARKKRESLFRRLIRFFSRPRRGVPRTDVSPTKDHRRRALELIEKHGWYHWIEKP